MLPRISCSYDYECSKFVVVYREKRLSTIQLESSFLNRLLTHIRFVRLQISRRRVTPPPRHFV
jgi:hypothetical protein